MVTRKAILDELRAASKRLHNALRRADGPFIERTLVADNMRKALRIHPDNLGAAARLLGVTPEALRYRLRKWPEFQGGGDE